jgi:hypothetical protein
VLANVFAKGKQSRIGKEQEEWKTCTILMRKSSKRALWRAESDNSTARLTSRVVVIPGVTLYGRLQILYDRLE